MMDNFIELNRSFALIPKDYKFNEDTYEYSLIFGISEEKKWNDLLKLHRGIILAEAGAGKTEEIQAITKKLRDEGNKAFFFRLEHLCSNFEASFEVGTASEFEKWLSSDEPAWFFLDSVDEARLVGPKNFETAIRTFGYRLNDNKQRCRIFITSRLSEWRAQSDLFLITRHLPFFETTSTTEEKDEKDDLGALDESSDGKTASVKKGETKPIEPFVFSLLPLDQDQIRTFTQAFGIHNVDAFLDALKRTEADIFARRPLDLIDLIDYWTNSGKIANRAKLIESSIITKLKEDDSDRATAFPLTFDDAIEGAEMIAADVSFQRKDRILIPEQNIEPELKRGSINAESVLSNWDSKQIRAILQRPVFDKAIYGTVRFHHRSVREYLTAKWLHRLLTNGKSRRVIEGLFFKEIYGQTVLVPSMRPILSWLILFDDRIRDKTARLAPEVFIQGGDPSALPTEFRKNMLERFCNIYSNQGMADLSFELSELRRFAHKDLENTVSCLLEVHSHNENIRELLLRIVWQGNLSGCSDKALEFALGDTADIYTRACGIRAIGVVGSEEQKNTLIKELLADPAFRQEQLIVELIEAFAPDNLSVQDILSFLERFDKSGGRSYSLDYPLKECCQHKFSTADIITWIQGVLPLIKQPPVIERRYFEVSRRYGWLLPYALIAAERLVINRHPNALDDKVLEVISLAQIGNHFHEVHLEKHDLTDLVPKWLELNHALFWFDVNAARNYLDKKKNERLTNWWQALIFGHFWRFDEDDYEAFLEDTRIKSNMDDRLVALSLAFEIYKEAGRGRARLQKLKSAVFGVPELEKTLHLYLHPPPMSNEQKRSRGWDTRFKRRKKERDKKIAENKRDWCERIQSHTHVLRDTSIASKGKAWNATIYLMEEIRNKRKSRNRWATSSWEDLIPEFGQDVAYAFRDGCMNYWRKYQPKIRSEGIEDPNSRPYAVSVGLSGLDMEARQNPKWPYYIAEDEAKLACRYALHEMNGFPDWFRRLHTAFPDIVEKCVLDEVKWEFSQYDGKESCHYVLDAVSWHLEWIKPRISSQILSFMQRYEPKHDDAFEKALGIVLSDPNLDRKAFVDIAKTVVHRSSSLYRKALWLAAWMRIEAKTALREITSILKKITEAQKATELSINFIVALLGDSRESTVSAYQDFVHPEILLSLIKLMHTHIRVEDDISRVGGRVFTPTFRDDAQEARGRLFQLLRDIPGKATYSAMIDLAEYHPNEAMRKRCLIHAKRRAEENSEGEPWDSGDIALFSEEAERPPKNHRELYDLSISRLLDLKADLEEGDTSVAEILISVKEERKHRNMIGGWLRDRAFGRYNVPQEDELADRKKPDIRIFGVGFDGPVPIELKVADNCTGSKLVERLHNQLCGQYLRDVRSNCGIFALVYRGEKKKWQHPKTGRKLKFGSLVKLLEKEVGEIISTNDKIESIKIIDIDLTKRQQ